MYHCAHDSPFEGGVDGDSSAIVYPATLAAKMKCLRMEFSCLCASSAATSALLLRKLRQKLHA